MGLGKAKRTAVAGSTASATTQGSSAPIPTQATFQANQRVAVPAVTAPAAPQPRTLGTKVSQNPPSRGLGPPAVGGSTLGNIWLQRSGASVVGASPLPQRGVSIVPSQIGRPALPPSDVASQMGGLTIDASTPVVNPSQGPTATEMGGGGKIRAAPSTCNSTMSAKQVIQSIYAKAGRFRRRDFKKGDIISLPFHVANMNPGVDPNDQRLAETCEGYVYSKRRMMVVLYCHTQDMTCLPLFSFEGKGIQGKPEHLRHEYVSVRNEKDNRFVNQGPHQPVAAKYAYKPFDPMSAIHLTGGKMVGCNEDISFCGRLTRSGYTQVITLYKNVCKAAESEPWKG